MGTRKARANDFIGIPAGGKHQITSVTDDLTLVWIYGELKGQKRFGRILAVGDEPKVDGCVIIKLGMWRYERPAWAFLTDMGVLYYGDGPIDMDYHYHDFHFAFHDEIKAYLTGYVRSRDTYTDSGYFDDDILESEAYVNFFFVTNKTELLLEGVIEFYEKRGNFVFAVHLCLRHWRRQDELRRGIRIPAANQDLPIEVHLFRFKPTIKIISDA